MNLAFKQFSFWVPFMLNIRTFWNSISINSTVIDSCHQRLRCTRSFSYLSYCCSHPIYPFNLQVVRFEIFLILNLLIHDSTCGYLNAQFWQLFIEFQVSFVQFCNLQIFNQLYFWLYTSYYMSKIAFTNDSRPFHYSSDRCHTFYWVLY